MRQVARLVLAGCVAAALAGCSVPSWVPLLGKSKGPAPIPPPPPPSEVRAPILSRPALPPDAEAVMDRVICVVNSDAVTLYELDEAEAYYLYENKQPRPPEGEERGKLRERLLSGIIEKRLQVQQAEREKITVEDAEMTERLGEIQKRLGATTQAEFEETIKAQGLNTDTIKKRVREQLLVERMIRRKVGLRVSVTEEEIDRYLIANREKLETGLSFEARHILFVPRAGSGEDGWTVARRRADAIYSRVLGGEDFGDLAREYSEDTGTAQNGGRLGVLKRGELAADIETAILRLSPGEHSPPFRSQVGYHLFELDSKETLAGEQLTQARNQIRDILYKQKYETRLQEWLTEIRGKAIIEMRL